MSVKTAPAAKELVARIRANELAPQELIELLRRPPSADVCVAAINALAEAVLAGAEAKASREEPSRVLHSLGETDVVKSFIQELSRLLHHPDEPVVAAAALALGRLSIYYPEAMKESDAVRRRGRLGRSAARFP